MCLLISFFFFQFPQSSEKILEVLLGQHLTSSYGKDKNKVYVKKSLQFEIIPHIKKTTAICTFQNESIVFSASKTLCNELSVIVQ